MRFLDKENIGLKFYKKITNQTIFFKAYLEKNEVQYKIQETVLPALSTGDGFSHLRTRIFNEISLDFNVYSENLEEAAENYEKLHILINFIKPRVAYNSGDGYKYDIQENDPRADLFFSFKGMPRILNSKILERDPSTGVYDLKSNPELDIDDIPIQVFNFSYSINKDMGYIEMPSDVRERLSGKLFSEKGTTLVPISYKVSIVARVSANIEFFNNVIYDDDTSEEFILPAFLPSHKSVLAGKPTPFMNSPVSSISSGVNSPSRGRSAPTSGAGTSGTSGRPRPRPRVASFFDAGFTVLDNAEFGLLSLDNQLKGVVQSALKNIGYTNLNSLIGTAKSNSVPITNFVKNIRELAATYSLLRYAEPTIDIKVLFARDPAEGKKLQDRLDAVAKFLNANLSAIR
jgi:hypothetical protein